MNRYSYNHNFHRQPLPEFVIETGQFWQSKSKSTHVIHVIEVAKDEVKTAREIKLARVEESIAWNEWISKKMLMEEFTYLEPVTRTDVF